MNDKKTAQVDGSAVMERLACGILPTIEEQKAIGFSTSEIAKIWMRGTIRAHKEAQKAASEAFWATGEGAAWYVEAKPQNKQEEAILEQTEEALEIVEKMYDAILSSGKKRIDGTIGIRDEDMLLKVSQFGDSEGILVKQCPYGNDIKVIITGHTGPRNYDPVEGSIEFEPGCKAFRFRLAYQFGMPSKEQLVQDVAAYLKISKERKGRGYLDEGGCGPDSRIVPFHKPMKVARMTLFGWEL